jgi:hypothetical protein
MVFFFFQKKKQKALFCFEGNPRVPPIADLEEIEPATVPRTIYDKRAN